MKKILFVVPYPKKIYPSARFRIELYEDALRNNNFQFETVFFWDIQARNILYKDGKSFQKIFGVIKGFARRFITLFTVLKYDYVFVLREASPIGPPFFEWVYAKLFRKKMIYDFDDAIWIPQISESHSWVKFAKSFWKVRKICKWAYRISVGNDYLYDYAARFNKNVRINPTCVDTVRKHNIVKDQQSEKVVIGWTGSFSTLHYLNEVVHVLQELEKKYEFEFLVIADQNPNLSLRSFKFIEWNEENEINDLIQCNIGIMPLYNNEFAQGKCGFKIIQFLSLGIPVVASPIGVNEQIVDAGINGFLCSTMQDWMLALEKLLTEASLRRQMGISGRKKIEEYYSEASNEKNFISLFD